MTKHSSSKFLNSFSLIWSIRLLVTCELKYLPLIIYWLFRFKSWWEITLFIWQLARLFDLFFQRNLFGNDSSWISDIKTNNFWIEDKYCDKCWATELGINVRVEKLLISLFDGDSNKAFKLLNSWSINEFIEGTVQIFSSFNQKGT